MKRWHFLLLWVTIATACNNHEPKESPKAASRIQEPSPQVKRLYQSVASYPDSIGLRLLLVNALDSAGDYRPALQQMDSLLRKDSLNFGLWFRKPLCRNIPKTPAAPCSLTILPPVFILLPMHCWPWPTCMPNRKTTKRLLYVRR